MDQPKKIAVGMSGGVDSSVAAALLKEKGHAVTGVIMEIYDESIPIQETAKSTFACTRIGKADSGRKMSLTTVRYQMGHTPSALRTRVNDGQPDAGKVGPFVMTTKLLPEAKSRPKSPSKAHHHSLGNALVRSIGEGAQKCRASTASSVQRTDILKLYFRLTLAT